MLAWDAGYVQLVGGLLGLIWGKTSQEDVLQALAHHEEIGSVIAQDSADRDDLSDEAMRLVRGDPDILVYASLKALRHRIHISNLNSLKVETESVLSQLQDARKH